MPEYYEPPVDSALQAEENKLVNTALSKLQQPYISGLKLNADIALYKTSTETSLTLNTIDDNNVVWVVSDIDGWWTLPESELPDLPRGWGDGSYDAIGRWSNRLLTLTGSFLPQSPVDATTARNQLLAFTSNLMKEAGAGYLIVDEGEYTSSQILGADYDNNDAENCTHTFTVAKGHEFVAGDYVKVRGVSPMQYNMTSVLVLSTTDETVTVSVGTYDISSETSGNATWVGGGVISKPLRKAAKVRLSGVPMITSVNARGRHDFSIGLKAVDPIKYEFVTGHPEGYDVAEIIPVTGLTVTGATLTNATENGIDYTYIEYTTSTTHGLEVGLYMRISDVIPSSLNYTTKAGLPITAVTDNTFTVKRVGTIVDTYTSGGTADSTSANYPITNKGNVPVPIIIETSENFSIIDQTTNPVRISNTESDQTITILEGTNQDSELTQIRLEIDTYNREVLDVDYSTIADGFTDPGVENARSKVAVLVDWIYLQPGENVIAVRNIEVGHQINVYYRSGWIG